MQSIQLRNLIQQLPELTGTDEYLLNARIRFANHFGVRPSSIRIHGETVGGELTLCGIDIQSGGMIVECRDAEEIAPMGSPDVVEFAGSVTGILRIA